MLILWYIYYVLTVELIMKYTTPERYQSRYVSFSVQKYHNCSLFWNTHQIYSFDYACYQFIMENTFRSQHKLLCEVDSQLKVKLATLSIFVCEIVILYSGTNLCFHWIQSTHGALIDFSYSHQSFQLYKNQYAAWMFSIHRVCDICISEIINISSRCALYMKCLSRYADNKAYLLNANRQTWNKIDQHPVIKYRRPFCVKMAR